jgi:methionyl-tRNA formyltransferase
MKIAFMGTPDFSVPSLESLILSHHDVGFVFTQPPRARGRGQNTKLSAVHAVAQKHNVPVYHPTSLKKDLESQEFIASQELDAIIVAAYGLMLPEAVLSAPEYGCLNIHASLLPRWRGAAPIQYSILSGDEKTGITIMQMEKGLDSGPIISQIEMNINENTTSSSLHDDLSLLGAKLITQTLDIIEKEKKVVSKIQNEDLVTYAPMLKKSDGEVDWSKSSLEIHRQIRALNPWPGVWTVTQDGKRIKIIEAWPEDLDSSFPPGSLFDKDGRVSCGEKSCLKLITVQPENKSKMDIVSALNGQYLSVDSVFT